MEVLLTKCEQKGHKLQGLLPKTRHVPTSSMVMNDYSVLKVLTNRFGNALFYVFVQCSVILQYSIVI